MRFIVGTRFRFGCSTFLLAIISVMFIVAWGMTMAALNVGDRSLILFFGGWAAGCALIMLFAVLSARRVRPTRK